MLTVRNLEPRMGIDNLVRAAGLLKKKGINFHLIIGGDGPEKMKISCLIDDQQLNEMVTLAGFIPSKLLGKYYAASDFFILPTRELEGFGLVTVESMACGTPVLGTPVGATKEILNEFDAGLLFCDKNPQAMADGIEQAVLEVFSNKASYQQLRGRCRRHVLQNYSWTRHINQLESLIIDEIQRTEKRLN